MITVKSLVCEHERGIRSLYDCASLTSELVYITFHNRQSYVSRSHAYVRRGDYTNAHGATTCDHANAPHVIIPSWTTTLAVSSNFCAAPRDNSIRNFVTAFSSRDPRRRWTSSLVITEFKVHPRPSLIILSASRYCNFVLPRNSAGIKSRELLMRLARINSRWRFRPGHLHRATAN